MSEPTIRTLPNFHEEREVEVHAKGSLWTLALEYIGGPARIRIQVKDSDKALWTCGTARCGPGGTYALSPTTIVPSAPIGALVAKIGGGEAECPGAPVAPNTAPQALPTSSTLYAVGRYCVISVKVGDGGPLFLTMNDDVKGFIDHDGTLTVNVAVAVG